MRMNYLTKLFLILLFTFIVPQFSYAINITTNCVNTNHNPATTGPFVNTDCVTREYDYIILQTSLDRSILGYSENKSGVTIDSIKIYNFATTTPKQYTLNAGNSASSSSWFSTTSLSSLPDGAYSIFWGNFLEGLDSYSETLPFDYSTQFWKKDGLYYLDQSDIPQGQDHSDLIYILGFILLCVMFVPLGFVYNSFIGKKHYD